MSRTGAMPGERRPCPICGKAAVDRYRPFCSKRCADRDLARWFGEAYRIPGVADPDPDADDPIPSPDADA